MGMDRDRHQGHEGFNPTANALKSASLATRWLGSSKRRSSAFLSNEYCAALHPMEHWLMLKLSTALRDLLALSYPPTSSDCKSFGSARKLRSPFWLL